MITLKEVCEKMRVECPNEYIYIINEFEKAYEVIMLYNGTKPGDYCPDCVSIVDKTTGEHELAFWAGDERITGKFKQYTQEDLRELLK